MIRIEPHALDYGRLVRPGDRVAWGQAAAEPINLTRTLVAQRHRIGGRFSVFMGAAWTDTVQPECADVMDIQSYSGAGFNRALAQAGVLDVLCSHYSTFERALAPGGPCRVDVLLLQLAPPGPDGRFSLSVAHEYLVPLVGSSRVVIAEVNAAAPWTFGSHTLSEADIDVAIWTDRPLPKPSGSPAGPIEQAIATRAAEHIEDGATLQLGVGTLPESVLSRLTDRRDLGIHSGAIGDAVADLSDAGVITNARKAIDRGLTIAGVMMGSRRLHAHAHRNPAVQFRPTSYTHDVRVLAALDGLVAINAAVEVDLTGQVNAEEARGRYVGAVGGALDFMRGAQLARGGLSIITLPSRAGAAPRIVAKLQGPVSTPRSDVALVVTEHGVADLRGASIAQRVQRMLAVAHPDDRSELERQYSLRSGRTS
ncbi:MAG TPA: acetyl-CoA hydrolase/transferase C-terminal domain-containing protein [Ramlibacter sp.]|nr:acetyl-CoA hydrolase/transferase C-terminal domain-containing protein [Ramlibacter sp.]